MNRSLLPTLVCVGALVACGGSPATTGSQHPTPTVSVSPSLPRQVQAVISTDHGPADLVVGRDALFVGNHRGGSIQRINPATNRLTATVTVGGQLVLESSTTWGGLPSVDEATTWLWACSNTDGVLHQVDPRTMRVDATVKAQCDGGWRTRVGNALWAVPGGDATSLLVVDLRTAKVVRRVPLGDPGPGWGPAVIAGGHVFIGAAERTPELSRAGRLLSRLPVSTPWLTSAGGRLYRLPEDGSLAELDPQTLAVVRTFVLPPHHDVDPLLVGDGAGHLYYRPDTMHVFTLDLGSGAVTPLLTLPSAETPTSMAWAFGSLWITNFDDDTVWRVDPSV